jgi:hypothetical protein
VSDLRYEEPAPATPADVVAALERGDPLVGPRAEDALDDLDTYLRA